MFSYELERSSGVVVSVGGQIPNTLCQPLHALNVRILGTSPEAIDCCEDRSQVFSVQHRKMKNSLFL